MKSDKNAMMCSVDLTQSLLLLLLLTHMVIIRNYLANWSIQANALWPSLSDVVVIVCLSLQK